MKTNTKPINTLSTHEGGKAVPQKPELELARAVSSCLLWENTFYEKGSDIGSRIAELCLAVPNDRIAALAIRARNDLHLRHVPLWLVVQLVAKKAGPIVRATMNEVIKRPDEMTELLSLYWKDGKKHVTRQLRRGLADAFVKWDAHRLKKWDREGAVRLRDVLFLCHAKPKDAEQAELWKALVAGTLPAAGTWEEELSSGADKKETWTRLLAEKKLGYMALLMNLRNMESVNVDRKPIREALISGAAKSKALPFRFVAAAKHAPHLADTLSEAMLLAISGETKLPGRTLFVVDVSGSMDDPLSRKGETKRLEAAGALAVLVREVCEEADVFTFSNAVVQVSNHRGLPLMDAIHRSQPHAGTQLKAALSVIKEHATADRVIVITDEQSQDGNLQAWTKWAYLINVSSDKPALDVSQGWKRINGFSERVVDWIRMEESCE